MNILWRPIIITVAIIQVTSINNDLSKKTIDVNTEPIKIDVDEIVDDVQTPTSPNIKFSDIDNKISTEGLKEDVFVSKDLDNLDRISDENEAFYANEGDDDDVLTIGEDLSLDFDDINSLDNKMSINDNNLVLDDIEELK